ncbi:diguanylate cyclase [Pseudomonas lalucatii]|uniref:diguanylate cyclase n=1 Tax=Pseudomonas lalucatii TaxID=1424203 RepID=A0ABS5Q3D8_9PSED|nr:diguanylate cyclase [Pseudomonas lalucatii]MBS7663232.1 diguanylate cyclase [Pseudomonas lalucatii]MBS7689945.1 diguanylate cyclase [Pseudomonas lalucatii]
MSTSCGTGPGPYDLGGRRARLLVVDDEPVFVRLIHQLFSAEHEVFMATSSEQALDICAHSAPDLILLDVVMPGMDGLELCRRLKQLPQAQAIPVIFVTARESLDEETACWAAGGVDFVNKPFNPLTLRNRVNVHLALKFQADRLREMAFVDGLTGIANRRQFEERLELEFRRSRRNGSALALLMIDVDFFKPYNDRYGHQAGDECLRRVASLLKASMSRPGDLAARYGGEEFVFLLPETNEAGARVIAQRLVDAVRQLNLEHLDSAVAAVVTISIGAAVLGPDSSESCRALVTLADAQLYRAKKQGRGRVCCALTPADHDAAAQT